MAHTMQEGFPSPAPTSAPDHARDAERSVQLLHAACDNRAIHKALERLLCQPAEHRQALVQAWVTDMRANQASGDFVHAVASLTEDTVADKANATIFRR